MAFPLFEKLRGLFSKKSAQPVGPKVTMAESLESAQVMGGLLKKPIVQKPGFEWTYAYAMIATTALMIADLGVLYVRDSMLPTTAPPARPQTNDAPAGKMRSQYNLVTQRNIFNSDGVIPPALSQPEGTKGDIDGPATPTSLPLALVGTIVHKNPAKSVATIEMKSGSQKVIPYIANDDIEGLATLLKVERKRAIFRNHQTNRNEYVEIKDKGPISFGVKAGATSAATVPAGQTEFSLPRTEVQNYMKNLPELLQQARAEPFFGSGGRIEGFKMMEIMPGSLYEKLGLKVGDLIKNVNGDAVDSPAKAMELYQSLRNSNRISVDVERDGKSETLTYTIN